MIHMIISLLSKIDCVPEKTCVDCATWNGDVLEAYEMCQALLARSSKVAPTRTSASSFEQCNINTSNGGGGESA